MGSHAVLSASSSHRWLSCSPSARLEQSFADSESEAAAEGTAAHALCEHKLKKALRMRSKKPVSKYDSDEMDACADDYAAFVLEILAQARLKCPDPMILVEQRLDFSRYVPDGFGTGDAVIVGDGTLHVVDFKYGQGILVDAEENPQMKLYALGALELFGSLYDIGEISMTIYQPRRENVSTWTISVDALQDWAETVLKPKAVLANEGKGEFCPGEWCTFCKAAVKCRARAEEKLKLASLEFALPPLLTDAEIGDVLDKLDDLVKWTGDIREYALKAALSGKRWNGYKLVEGRSNRRYTDEDAVAKVARDAGYHDIYTRSLLGVTAMEKYLGRDKFSEVLGGLIEKPAGKPTLAPLSDKRPAMNRSAKNDFTTITEE